MSNFTPQTKSGQGWTYDQASITYDGATDPSSGSTVSYDGLGTQTTWTPQTKS